VREAVLDGDNLEMITSRATKQTKNLDQVRDRLLAVDLRPHWHIA
jgi:hypothetical protein